MIVPYQSLSSDALAGVVEEYVTRDGTELTDAETKSAAVRRALERGELVVVFDAESGTCNLLPPEIAAEALPDGERVELDDQAD